MEKVFYIIGDCYEGTTPLILINIVLIVLVGRLLKKWLANKSSKKYLIFIGLICLFLIAANMKQYRNIGLCKVRAERLAIGNVTVINGKLKIGIDNTEDIILLGDIKLHRGWTMHDLTSPGCWDDYFHEDSPYIGKEVEISYLRDKYTPKRVDCIVKIVVYE